MSEPAENVRQHAHKQMRLLREHLLQGISDGEYTPDQKLPPERLLAEKFELGRHAVRKVLKELELQGRVVRHVGRGTYPTEGYAAIDRYRDLACDLANPKQVMEVRILIEPRTRCVCSSVGFLDRRFFFGMTDPSFPPTFRGPYLYHVCADAPNVLTVRHLIIVTSKTISA